MEVNPADEIKRLNTEKGNLIIARARMKSAGNELGIRRADKRLKEIDTEMQNWGAH
jgi:hypothetical protein